MASATQGGGGAPDQQMEGIARKLADYYVVQGSFWDQLRTATAHVLERSTPASPPHGSIPPSTQFPTNQELS